MSKELYQMVKKIQFERNLTIEEVAESVGYSRVHLQREMKKEGPSPVIDILKNKYKDVIQNVTPAENVVTSNELIQAITRLAESNEKIVQSNSEAIASNKGVTQKVADTNSKLADTNAELVQLLKQKSGEISSDVQRFALSQAEILALLKAAIEVDLDYKAGGDEKKANELAAKIGRATASNLGLNQKKDNPVVGKRNS